jgi:DNA gyrase subunit A
VAAEVAAGLDHETPSDVVAAPTEGAVEQAADNAEVATAAGTGEVKPQFVFTITDGGFAKRTRISDYRIQSRGGLGIKAMSLANEDRGGLVGAFIVEDGDEVLSITQGGQVVRSPINSEFRPTGRSTMGVKFVTPNKDEAVAVVARTVEAREEEADEVENGPVEGVDQAGGTEPADLPADLPSDLATDVALQAGADDGDAGESLEVDDGATIDGPTESAEE